MKIKLILLVAAIVAFASNGFGQSVQISGKKVTYKRAGKVDDYKKTFEINYPVVKGANGKKIEAILSYEKNFDFKLKEQQSGKGNWLDGCDFTVNYNKNNVLDVTLSIKGSGAYPSGDSKYLVINSKTGTRVKPSDVFTNLNGLAALGRKTQQAEIKKAAKEIKENPDSADFDPSEYFNNAKFTAENLWAFTVSEKGITFHYDYGFPHVALALQPDGEYFYKWSELKPFIKKDGLFGVFVK